MSNFSRRWAMPSNRHEESLRSRRKGGGSGASCRARLEGWIRHVAARSTIWGDVDLEAFCEKTGYSREHATRVLSSIRRESSDLVFETKLRQKKRGRKKRWGVIVAERAKLLFDGRSLFYDRCGNRLHNYTTLENGGTKITPAAPRLSQPVRRRGRPPKQPGLGIPMKQMPTLLMSSESPQKPESGTVSNRKSPDQSKPSHRRADFFKNGRPCDNAYNTKHSFGIQRTELYGAQRDITQSFEEIQKGDRTIPPFPLRKKAFAMLGRLFHHHWDNCKVIFARPTAYRFALDALAEGHEESNISACYSKALFACHGLAVDRAASTGCIVYFNLSSTVTRARRLLAKDGSNSKERISLWYRNHPRNAPSSVPFDAAELRRKIAASLGCSEPEAVPRTDLTTNARRYN